MLKEKLSLNEYLIKQNDTKCTEQTLSCLFRAILEPVLESSNESENSDIIFKITNRELFTGLLTRLEFSDKEYYDLRENEPENYSFEEIDFLLVLNTNFSSLLAWKHNEEEEVCYYNFTNTEDIKSIVDIVDCNSENDFSYLVKKYNFTNYQNSLVNSCINKLLAALSTNTNCGKQDLIEENSIEDLNTKIETLTKKSRYISHEIKNQLSICDLYSGIIKKYCEKNDIQKDTIDNAVNCIDKSIHIANDTLVQLKTINTKELALYDVKELINSAVNLSKVYIQNRDIKLVVENNIEEEIFVDENLFMSVIINLVKNACEAFNGSETGKSKKIKISTKVENDEVKIQVSNNAGAIPKPDELFQEGKTTKINGNGLGLVICKQSVEEQCGQLNLIKTDEESTVFEIKFCL